MAALFMIAVAIVIAGWLWFYLVRPILVDYGVVRDEEIVNTSRPVMSPPPQPVIADEQTDETDGPSVSAVFSVWERTRLDKTRAAWIELMVYSGYTTAEIRAILKGENATIGAEVEAARKRLGVVAPDRTLRVKDEKGERMIPLASR